MGLKPINMNETSQIVLRYVLMCVALRIMKKLFANYQDIDIYVVEILTGIKAIFCTVVA